MQPKNTVIWHKGEKNVESAKKVKERTTYEELFSVAASNYALSLERCSYMQAWQTYHYIHADKWERHWISSPLGEQLDRSQSQLNPPWQKDDLKAPIYQGFSATIPSLAACGPIHLPPRHLQVILP